MVKVDMSERYSRNAREWRLKQQSGITSRSLEGISLESAMEGNLYPNNTLDIWTYGKT